MGSCYGHLTLGERRLVYQLKEAKMTVPRIAERLGRHRATIYRELHRNWHHDREMPAISGYYPTVAQEAAVRRRHGLGKIQRNASLAAFIVEQLRNAWSPEQIAGRMRAAGCSPDVVCHETIYRFVYGPEGRAAALHRLLPSRRRRRRSRYARKPRGLFIPAENTIKLRPADINQRTVLGHWECDLVGFRQVYGQHKLTTLVERVSRYVVLVGSPSRHTETVMAGITAALSPFPPAFRQTITFDRGTEFTGYGSLKAALGIQSYFCAPQAPWQKGTVENTNGRLRRFLPLDTDLATRSKDELSTLAHRLNTTPRKCLQFRTPAEVMDAWMTAHAPSPILTQRPSHFS